MQNHFRGHTEVGKFANRKRLSEKKEVDGRIKRRS